MTRSTPGDSAQRKLATVESQEYCGRVKRTLARKYHEQSEFDDTVISGLPRGRTRGYGARSPDKRGESKSGPGKTVPEFGVGAGERWPGLRNATGMKGRRC